MVFPLDGILTILDQGCQERFSKDFQFHSAPAPWIPFWTSKRLANLAPGEESKG
jgi:hypothetical protein